MRQLEMVVLLGVLSHFPLQLKAAIDAVLITNHMETLQSDFLRMLRTDTVEGARCVYVCMCVNAGTYRLIYFLNFLRPRFADMRRLYLLLARVENGLRNTANTFQVFLTEAGTKIVQQQKERDVKEALLSAVAFVRELMDFYEKYANLVNQTFVGHTLFKEALDKVQSSEPLQSACLFIWRLTARNPGLP